MAGKEDLKYDARSLFGRLPDTKYLVERHRCVRVKPSCLTGLSNLELKRIEHDSEQRGGSKCGAASLSRKLLRTKVLVGSIYYVRGKADLRGRGLRPDDIDRDFHRRNRSSVLKPVCGVPIFRPAHTRPIGLSDSISMVGDCSL